MEPPAKRRKLVEGQTRGNNSNKKAVKKRVTIKNSPTNTYYVNSKENYKRGNKEELVKSMKEGRIAVTIGTANAYKEGRQVTPNNISEPRKLSKNNIKTIGNTLKARTINHKTKRRAVLNKIALNKEFEEHNAFLRRLGINPNEQFSFSNFKKLQN